MSKKLDNQIKAYIKKETGIIVQEKNMSEIRESLVHLGKAIFLYHQQKRRKP